MTRPSKTGDERNWFDPVGAWQRLHPKVKEQLGAAAMALGVADLGIEAEGGYWDGASTEAAKLIQATVQKATRFRRGDMPEGIDLAALDIQQCRCCGRTDSQVTDAGWTWSEPSLCSDCDRANPARVGGGARDA